MGLSSRTRVAIPCALVVLGGAAFAAPGEVHLPADMIVALELQHHINSAYSPEGSPVYFRVSHDVVVDAHTLIAKGTLVQGKIVHATNRGMVGRAGTMTLGVRTVKAVDGTDIPINLDLAKQGRSRAGATVGWTLFWGLPGLITRGVNPYIERGTILDATTVADTSIDLSHAGEPAAAAVAATPLELHVTGYKFEGGRPNETLTLDIERNRDLKTVTFNIEPANVSSVELIAADDGTLAEPISARAVSAAGATFGGWEI